MENQIKEKRKWGLGKKIALGIGGLIILLIIIGSLGNGAEDSKEAQTDQSTSNEQSQPEEIVKVSAVQLSKAYDENKVAADAKYEGKKLEISGVISDIGKDITGTPYVVLKGVEYKLFGVQCMFPRAKEAALINLTKGQSLTVQGKLSGELIGNVVVRDCEIVQ